MIIIPIKWLFHWEYTLFSDIGFPASRNGEETAHLKRGNFWMCCPTVTGVPKPSPFSLPATRQLPSPEISETFRNTNRSSVAIAVIKHQESIWYVWVWASSTVDAVIPPNWSRWIGSWGESPAKITGLPRPTRPSWSWRHLHPCPADMGHPDTGGKKKNSTWDQPPPFPEMISISITQLLRCLRV